MGSEISPLFINKQKTTNNMTTLKMSDEDGKLLINVLIKFTNDYRPMVYGGQHKPNPPINEEEWLRLNQLIQKFPYEIKL